MVQRFYVLQWLQVERTERKPVRMYGVILGKDSTQHCTISGRLQNILCVVTERAVEQLSFECGTFLPRAMFPLEAKRLP
jgi:hypothetical protein